MLWKRENSNNNNNNNNNNKKKIWPVFNIYVKFLECTSLVSGRLLWFVWFLYEPDPVELGWTLSCWEVFQGVMNGASQECGELTLPERNEWILYFVPKMIFKCSRCSRGACFLQFLGSGFKHVFHPYLGKMDPNGLAHIFQMGGEKPPTRCVKFQWKFILFMVQKCG